MQSRITTKLEFKDYETEVLKNVLDKELETYKLRLDLEANKKVLENIEQAKKKTDFGNCRYVKNLAIEIVKNYTYTNETSKIIKKNCIPTVMEPTRNIIGFR